MDLQDLVLECKRLYAECKEHFKKPEVVRDEHCSDHIDLYRRYRVDYRILKNERKAEIRDQLVPDLFSLSYVNRLRRIVHKMVILATFCIRFTFARALHRQLNSYLHGPYIDRSALAGQILQMQYILTELIVIETNVIVENTALDFKRFDMDMANNVNELLDRLFEISNSLTRMFTWQRFPTKQELRRKEKFFETDIF